MLILYLAVLVPALYWVSRILGPEMAKAPSSGPASVPDGPSSAQTTDPDKRIEKLNTILAEKNKNISLLEKELRFFHIQSHAFNKVKTLLEEEIHRLKEQNRIFRSELGIPAAQPKENSIT